jgi:hypothetical protein
MKSKCKGWWCVAGWILAFSLILCASSEGQLGTVTGKKQSNPQPPQPSGLNVVIPPPS